MRFHQLLFLDNAYTQRNTIQWQTNGQSKPGLAYQCNGDEFRNDVQKIIGMPEIFKKKGFIYLLGGGNNQFYSPHFLEIKNHDPQHNH